MPRDDRQPANQPASQPTNKPASQPNDQPACESSPTDQRADLISQSPAPPPTDEPNVLHFAEVARIYACDCFCRGESYCDAEGAGRALLPSCQVVVNAFVPRMPISHSLLAKSWQMRLCRGCRFQTACSRATASVQPAGPQRTNWPATNSLRASRLRGRLPSLG